MAQFICCCVHIIDVDWYVIMKLYAFHQLVTTALASLLFYVMLNPMGNDRVIRAV